MLHSRVGTVLKFQDKDGLSLKVFFVGNVYILLGAKLTKGPILYLIFCHCHSHSHSHNAYQQCLPSISVQSHRINIAKAL